MKRAMLACVSGSVSMPTERRLPTCVRSGPIVPLRRRAADRVAGAAACRDEQRCAALLRHRSMAARGRRLLRVEPCARYSAAASR